VAVGNAGGRIGLTFCPGKKQVDAASGAWDRSLADDMNAIKAFGAAALVTLMPDTELESLLVPPDQIRSKASELGVEWYQLPIQDAGVPDKGFEHLWADSGLRAAPSCSAERWTQYCYSLQGWPRPNGYGSRQAVDRVRDGSQNGNSVRSQSPPGHDRERVAGAIRPHTLRKTGHRVMAFSSVVLAWAVNGISFRGTLGLVRPIPH
jgi:hypothetical protein